MSDGRRARLGSGIEPGPLTSEERAEFLARPLIARLGTVRADGAPYVNPLWYHWDGEVFWLVARRRSALVEHLRTNSRICLSIASDELPYTRVTVIGKAEIANPDGSWDAWRPLMREMTSRYVGELDDGYADRTSQFDRWLIRIIPEEMVTWRGGGWARRYTAEEES